MQPVHYHYKNNQSNIGKKHTAQFKYVVKSVPLSMCEVMRNILFYVDIVTRVK